MIFKSRRDWWIELILWLSNILCLVASVKIGWSGLDKVLVNVFIIALVTLLFSMLYGTYYQLIDGYLIYRTGPFGGKIKAEDIKEIYPNKVLYVGFRPAVSTKGLVLKYFKYEDLYISPKRKEEFIEELLKLNPEIKVNK